MEKQTVMHFLMQAAHGAKETENALLTLIGYFNNGDLNSVVMETSPTCEHSQFNSLGNGYGNQTQSTTLEEIKAMIVELKIKGSVRERANGLIELRTQALGSIYGRTKEEIETKLNQRLKEAKKEKQANKKQTNVPLLSKFYEESYLPYKKASNLAEGSILDIAFGFNFIIKSGMDKPINKYTTEDLENFLHSVPQTRKRKKLRGLFNNILSYAKRLGKIKSNPCDNVEQIKHEEKIGRALSFKDQWSFFDTLYSNGCKLSDLEKAYLTFVYLTGTRRQEALDVQTSHVDYENNVLHIPGTKTGGSNRDIPLFPIVRDLLLSVSPQSGKIFNLPKYRADRLMGAITEDYHLHELRHTFGTIATCVQKLDPKTVSLYMGHTTVGMTLTRYTHPEQLDKALFYNGSLSEEEKILQLKKQYNTILNKIAAYLASHTQNIPKKINK